MWSLLEYMDASQDPPTYTWSVRREPTGDGVLDVDHVCGSGDSPEADAVHLEMPHAVMTEVVQDAVQGVRVSRTRVHGREAMSG